MLAHSSTDCNDDTGNCATLNGYLQLLVDYSAHTDLTGKLVYLAASSQSINVLTAFKNNGTIHNAISELQRSVCRPDISCVSIQADVLPAF